MAIVGRTAYAGEVRTKNGTVMAKGRGWMDDVDPRAIRVTVAVDRHEK